MRKNSGLINKILVSVLLFSFSLIFIGRNNTINASVKTTYNDAKNASWTPEVEEKTKFNGLEYIYSTGNTVYNGETALQQINVFKMKTDGVTSKLVNWAIQDGNSGYKKAALSKIAEDYEKNHPGWIVVAGINADQYALKYGGGGGNNSYLSSAPYYPVIMDGEVRFPFASINGQSCQYVGFKNDGSTNGIVDASPTKCFALYILDENGKEIAEFELSGINKSANPGETTVWTSLASNIASGEYISKTIPTTLNSVYYVENSDLAYAQTSIEYGMYDVVYGKGTISSIVNTATVEEGQFAIETSNENVKNSLKIGSKIKVQAKFVSDEMNNVETAAGFHAIHRNNGTDLGTTAPYDTKRYNRSIFGQTADGTYVLLTADMTNASSTSSVKYKGLSFADANAVLKHYGVTEAYQQDGGGSVTAIVRNNDGRFSVVNNPSDAGGNQRSIFNGMFFVVRDPGFSINNSATTRNSIEINVKDDSVFEKYKNIKVVVENKTYDLTSSKLTIDGLNENTEYIIDVKYDVEVDGKNTTGTYQLKVKTDAFKMPNPGLSVSTINKESIIVTKEDGEYSSWIQNVVVHVGDNTYNMGNEKEFEITNLISETKYDVYFSYNVVEPSTGNIYNGQTEPRTITTLAIELPKIIKFEVVEVTETTVKVAYEYEDKDDAVEVVQVIYNNSKYVLTKKRGNLVIEGFNIDEQNKITMKLFYFASETNIFTDEISKEIEVIKDITEEPIVEKKGCKGCSKSTSEYLITSLSAISLLVLVLRKKK